MERNDVVVCLFSVAQFIFFPMDIYAEENLDINRYSVSIVC